MAIKKNKSKKSNNKPAAKKAGRAKATATKPKAKAAKPAAKTRAAQPLLPKDLEKRLFTLARQMEKTIDGLMLQALCEFADAWEDHFRTVQSLQDDDRIVLSVKPD